MPQPCCPQLSDRHGPSTKRELSVLLFSLAHTIQEQPQSIPNAHVARKAPHHRDSPNRTRQAWSLVTTFTPTYKLVRKKKLVAHTATQPMPIPMSFARFEGRRPFRNDAFPIGGRSVAVILHAPITATTLPQSLSVGMADFRRGIGFISCMIATGFVVEFDLWGWGIEGR